MARPRIGAPTTIRLDDATLERVDKVAARLTRPGLELTRTDALRVCLLTGLEALEREARTSPPGGPSSRRGAVAPTLARVPTARKRRGPKGS